MVPSSDVPWGTPSVAARKRLLVVEDELLIRLIISEELRDAGYDVIEAFNGDEAVVIIKSQVAFDLIITDVRMPGEIDGLGLLAMLKEADHAVPVIVTSGHLDGRVALAAGARQFLAKPYGLDVMRAAVQQELGQPI